MGRAEPWDFIGAGGVGGEAGSTVGLFSHGTRLSGTKKGSTTPLLRYHHLQHTWPPYTGHGHLGPSHACQKNPLPGAATRASPH